MATETYQVQLERVQTAIAKLINGAQEYSIDGRNFKFANLAELNTMEDRLRVKAAREARGGGLRFSYGQPR